MCDTRGMLTLHVMVACSLCLAVVLVSLQRLGQVLTSLNVTMVLPEYGQNTILTPCVVQAPAC